MAIPDTAARPFAGNRLLLAGAGLAAGLLLAEGLLALLWPQVHRLPAVWEHDDRLGWRHIPGASGRLVTPEFDVEYRIDGQGLRSHRHLDTGLADESGLLLFGDSFAEGWGVDVELGLAAQLEGALVAVGRPAVVHNFGVAGYGTDQELLAFEARSDAYLADLVIVLFYGNDLWNNVSRRGIGAERGLKPRFELGHGGLRLTGVPVPRTPPSPTDFRSDLARHSHVGALLRKAWAPQPLGEEQLVMYYGGLYGRDAERFRSLWELTEQVLAAFAGAARRQGTRFALVYAPAIVQIDDGDWRAKRDLHGLAGEDYDLTKPSRELRDIAGRHEIPFLDLYPDFASAAPGTTLFYRDSHWTPVAHQVAAQAVARFVLAENLLPARSAGDG